MFLNIRIHLKTFPGIFLVFQRHYRSIKKRSTNGVFVIVHLIVRVCLKSFAWNLPPTQRHYRNNMLIALEKRYQCVALIFTAQNGNCNPIVIDKACFTKNVLQFLQNTEIPWVLR